jgi:hypothetical protein
LKSFLLYGSASKFFLSVSKFFLSLYVLGNAE